MTSPTLRNLMPMVVVAILSLHVSAVFGRSPRQEGNCTDLDTFDSLTILTDLDGEWYISGMSSVSMESYLMTCFRWNVTAESEKAKVEERFERSNTENIYIQSSLFTFQKRFDGSLSVFRPNWGSNRGAVTSVGVSGDHAVVIKCNDEDKPYIVLLSRNQTDLFDAVLSTFSLPSSPETYLELEGLQNNACEDN